MRVRPLLLVYGTGPVAALVLVWLAQHNLVADTPYWVLLALVTGTSVLNLLTLLCTRRASPAIRMHARLAVSAVTTAAVLYAAGWGSILAVAFAMGVADVMRSEGSKASRPGLCWSALLVLAGQIAVAADVAPSMISIGLSHSVAITNVCCLGVVLHTLGSSARDAEDAREKIRVDREQFRDLVQHAADVIVLVRADGDVAYISPGVEAMLGISADKCREQDLKRFMEPADRIAFEELCTDLVGSRPRQCELRFLHVNGSSRRISATVTARGDGFTRVVNLHDVTRQRDLEDQLRRQATVDTLTGLPNRHALMERLALMREESHVALFFIDLDGFKEVNDTLGHEAGDRVLVEAARRLAHSVPADTVVGRLGGDEFIAFNTQVGRDRALELAASILSSFAQRWPDLGDHRIGASIGIARSHDDEALDELVRRADAAMYEAKCGDKGGVVATISAELA